MAAWLFLSGCATDSAEGPLSGRNYDFAPAVARPQEPSQGETEDQPGEEPRKRGFFSFLSGKDKSDESENRAANQAEPSDETAGDEQEAEPADEITASNTPPAERTQPGDEVDSVYRLKVGDQVFITLSGSGGLSEQIETLIDEEGGVKLRFIGSVQAAGRTASELEREIEAEYTERQKIYKEVVARVVVPNTFYFIGGEVRQPGRFSLVGRVTLSQAIPSAGNFTEWANERKIVLARGDDRFVINFREIADDPTKDIELQPGDVITVERRSFL